MWGGPRRSVSFEEKTNKNPLLPYIVSEKQIPRSAKTSVVRKKLCRSRISLRNLGLDTMAFRFFHDAAARSKTEIGVEPVFSAKTSSFSFFACSSCRCFL